MNTDTIIATRYLGKVQRAHLHIREPDMLKSEHPKLLGWSCQLPSSIHSTGQMSFCELPHTRHPDMGYEDATLLAHPFLLSHRCLSCHARLQHQFSHPCRKKGNKCCSRDRQNCYNVRTSQFCICELRSSSQNSTGVSFRLTIGQN